MLFITPALGLTVIQEIFLGMLFMCLIFMFDTFLWITCTYEININYHMHKYYLHIIPAHE